MKMIKKFNLKTLLLFMGLGFLIATGPGHISSDFGTSYQIQTMSHRQIKAACTAVVLQ